MSIDSENTTPMDDGQDTNESIDPDATIRSEHAGLSMGLGGKLIGHYKLLKELGHGGLL